MQVETYYDKKKASAFLTEKMGIPISVNTLSKYIVHGSGPLFHKWKHRVLYTESSLIDWVNKNMSPECRNSIDGGRYARKQV